MVISSSLIGYEIAPDNSLATLPLTVQVIAYAASIIPVTHMMNRYGRRLVILTSLGLGVLSLISLGFAAFNTNFWLFTAASGLLGIALAHTPQFRFVAIEGVRDDKASQALTMIMLAGVGAAFLGPEVAVSAQRLSEGQWYGPFIGAAFLLIISFVLIATCLPRTHANHEAPLARKPSKLTWSKSLTIVLTAGALGGGIMTFIMTATPITMHHDLGFSLSDTKWVIQSHIVAMFAPSLLTTFILRTLNIRQMMLLGVMALAGCIAIALNHNHFQSFWIALVLLGIGWNFLFVGSTLLLPKVALSHEQLRAQGLLDGSAASLQAAGTIGAGALLSIIGWEGILWTCAGMTLFLFGAIKAFRISPSH
ncbi:MAG: MFS transporter [Gammaproteobacteria bacterium]|nr:MFS transporter [Gammaproteobacteria bacterium]